MKGQRTPGIPFVFFGLCFAIGLALAYVLATPQGSARLTAALLSGALETGGVSIDSMEGSLIRGLRLRGVQVSGGSGRLAGTRLSAESVALVPLSDMANSQGIVFALRGVRMATRGAVRNLSASSVEGTWPWGFVAREVRLQGVTWLPAVSLLDIQQLDGAFPLRFEHLSALYNGRLRLPYSEPLLFYGTQQRGAVSLRLYAKGLGLHEALGTLSETPSMKHLSGALSEVNLSVQGTLARVAVTGQLHVDQLSRKGFSLAEAPTTVNVIVHDPLGSPQLFGELVLLGGRAIKRVALTLDYGKLIFNGDPWRPIYDVQGDSTVGETRIHIVLQGPRDAADLRLSSDPPMAQEDLLAMLITGKTWQGAQQAIAHGAIPSELATDFIDYMLFGGFGNKVAKRFGISDFSLTADAQTNRVGVQTTFADRFAVDVEVEPTQPADGAAPAQSSGQTTLIPYKVGAEYKITNTTSVEIEGERTVLDQSTAQPAQTSAGNTSLTSPQTDDKVLLKIKKRF